MHTHTSVVCCNELALPCELPPVSFMCIVTVLTASPLLFDSPTHIKTWCAHGDITHTRLPLPPLSLMKAVNIITDITGKYIEV